MNDKEVMNLLNSLDDDLIDQKIDELLAQKGEEVPMNRIKERAMDRMLRRNTTKRKPVKRALLAASLIAVLSVSTVYAEDLTHAISSLFHNKSTLYSTVVEGDAYYLPGDMPLDGDLTLTYVSMSKDKLDLKLRTGRPLDSQELQDLQIAILPKNGGDTRYTVGGYGVKEEQKELFLSFYNERQDNYGITPVQEFTLQLGGKSYPVALAKSDRVDTGKLVLGTPENPSLQAVGQQDQTVRIAGSMNARNGSALIQLIPDFQDPELKLSSLGEPASAELVSSFKHDKSGILSIGGRLRGKPITAYGPEGQAYELKAPKEGEHKVNSTLFEVDGIDGATPLTVKLPAVIAHYEKDVASVTVPLPPEGEVEVNREVDFVLQKAVVHSVKRLSDQTAAIEFELNTGGRKDVSLGELGVYSNDVTEAKTVLSGNKAVVTVTFEPGLTSIPLQFTWPHYVIRGDWSIALGGGKG